MAETEPRPKSSGAAFKTFMATIGSSLLVFFTSLVWSAHEKGMEAISNLSMKVKELEDDKAKWATLTDLHNKVIELDRNLGLHENNVEWVKWALQHGISTSRTTPSGSTPPIPNPLPVAPPPAPKKPEESKKLIEPDELKRMYQQRYPNPNQEQQKK